MRSERNLSSAVWLQKAVTLKETMLNWNYRHRPPFSRSRPPPLLLSFPLKGQNSSQQRPLSSLSGARCQAS
ncbi:hypothetical protein TNCV_1552861 [Trichonephila clavipes]|nr:hypothetical protein TNCV_1552861 [Trichonephila clavipes]